MNILRKMLLTSLVTVSAPFALAQTGCRYGENPNIPSGFDSGGPYLLRHFKLNKDRLDLRAFLWEHWHGHKRGIAIVDVETIDAGRPRFVYAIQPDESGTWKIDVESYGGFYRNRKSPCSSFTADSLIRSPITNPNEDYPLQTLCCWPPGALPARRLANHETKPPKLYLVILVAGNKSLGDAI